MVCVLAILFAHEMGHFVATLIHRIPASLPFFIPLPIVSPIGTMGAVIAMDGRRADRREVFDIGISGPIAGLVFAIPILIYGVWRLDFSRPYFGPAYDSPLLVDLLVGWLRDTPNYRGSIAQGQLNPYFMAGWVGLLITGLNMMPVSQLDGGHVIYTLFGRSAHWVARGFIFFAILFIVFGGALNWLLMLILVILMGTDHPPTRDDSISLGPLRTTIGFCSLIIPVLCFPPHLFVLP
jgi:membrane-associated protease RseP (regulator of RpoE activity)